MAGRKPGSPKTGGRQRGTPNKSTQRCRDAISLIAEDMADDFKSWLLLTASGDEDRGIKPDPKGAADIYLKAIEYHIPKLARTEHVGDGGGPVVVAELDASKLSTSALKELMNARRTSSNGG